MGEVISFQDHLPHCHGDALCLDCKHEWVARATLPTEWLECPNCGLEKGRFKYTYVRGDVHWEGECGNDLFKITPQGIYCPNCGVWQVGM